MACSLITLVRNVQGYTRVSPWYILEVACTVPTMFTVFFNGLCTSNMFMVLQVVALWLYMSYKFCIFDYKNMFYRGMGWAWVNQHSMHLHSVTLSKMLCLG